MCPHCRQNAPIVYRGVTATCTTCGRPRMPLTGASVNLAGQPSKVGGTLARVFGWITLAGGWLVAGLVFAACAAVSAAGAVAPWLLGGLLAFIATVVAWVLLRGGKQLTQSGAKTEEATKNQAIFGLAAARGGVLTAWDVAQALAIPPQEADAMLTKLAKEQLDLVKVDVDDEGRILYRFTSLTWAHMQPPPHVRVESPRAGVRVDGTAPVRVDEREPLSLDDDEAFAPPQGARAHKAP